MQWNYVPKKISLVKSFVIVGVCLIASLIATLLVKVWFSGFLGFFLVLGFVQDVIFATKFKLDEKGASRRTFVNSRFINWKDVKRILWAGDQILLSPFPNGSKLDAFRGVLLVCADNKSSVVDSIEQYTGVKLQNTEKGYVLTRQD